MRDEFEIYPKAAAFMSDFVFKTRAGEPEPGVFGSLEPEPLEKKTRSRSRLEKKSGAGAGKN